jgi:hypothetical protein
MRGDGAFLAGSFRLCGGGRRRIGWGRGLRPRFCGCAGSNWGRGLRGRFPRHGEVRVERAGVGGEQFHESAVTTDGGSEFVRDLPFEKSGVRFSEETQLEAPVGSLALIKHQGVRNDAR